MYDQKRKFEANSRAKGGDRRTTRPTTRRGEEREREVVAMELLAASALVKKINHSLPDVRNRALESLNSKLRNGIASSEKLARGQLDQQI